MASELSRAQVPTESKKDSASQQPWLLITDGENCRIQNNMFNNKPLQDCCYDVGAEIPEFLGRYVGRSRGEWVLLYGSYDDGLPHVLVNVLSKETIELPLMDLKYYSCILLSDPTCHIVFLNLASLITWQPGEKEFTIKKWDEIFPGAVLTGKDLVMAQFTESTYRFELIQLDCTEIKDLCSQDYCFYYSGDLFKVRKIMCGHYSSNVAGFTVFKTDLVNKKWVRIKNLERLAIFIGFEKAQSHFAAVDSGIAGNSIYFLEQDDLYNFYVYDLEKGTVRMKPIVSSVETREDAKLDWIMMHGDPSFPKFLKEHQEIIHQDSGEEKGEVEQDEVQESWSMVLPELLNLIQLCLFGRDYAVFRLVCKSWQKASIRDYSIPSLLSSSTLLEQCQSFSPLLMYQEDRASSCDSVPIFRFFDPVHRKLYRTRIPELKEADIQYSRDGWLLMLRSSDESIFFFNPLTQEKIELPRMPPHEFAFKDFLSFSSPPTCSNCLVVGVNGEDDDGTIYTLRHGDETWRKYDLNYGRRDWCNIVVLNGLHYFMRERRKYRDMVVFNLNGVEGQEVFDDESWTSKFRRSKSLREESFLVEIDGGAILVSVEPNGGEINIYKWNDLEKDWELMEGGAEFGGKQMFLSKRGSFMEKIDDVGGMGNTIFLPMIDDAKAGVFYSLATQKYHTFYSGYSSKLPYNVDKFLDGIWVKPDRKIVGHNHLKWCDPQFSQVVLILTSSEPQPPPLSGQQSAAGEPPKNPFSPTDLSDRKNGIST